MADIEVTEKEQGMELKLRDEWLEEARKQTPETIGAFVNHLINDYTHDYGTIVRAIAAAACGAAWAVEHSPQGGITGFQGSCVKWDFIQGWEQSKFEVGARLVNYEKMLYPQYEQDFEKVISSNTWSNLQKKASELINEGGCVHPEVLAHWKSIVDGKVPFGYTVLEE